MVFEGVLSWWTGKMPDEDSDDGGGDDPPSPQPPPSAGTGEAQAENSHDILLSEFRQMRDKTIGQLEDRIGAAEENLAANSSTIDKHGDRIGAVEEYLGPKRGIISQLVVRIGALEENSERQLKQVYRTIGELQDGNQNYESNPPEDSRPVFELDGGDDRHGQLKKDDNNYSQSPPPEDPGLGDVNDDDHESDVDPFDDHVPDVDSNPNIMQVLQGLERRGQLKDENNYSQSTHAGNSLIDLTQQPDQDDPNSTQQQGAVMNSSRPSNVRISDGSTMESSTGSADNTSPPATANKRKLPEATPPAPSPPDPSTFPDQGSGTSAAQQFLKSPPGMNRTTSTNTIQGGQCLKATKFFSIHKVKFGQPAYNCWPADNHVAGFVVFPEFELLKEYIAAGRQIIEGQIAAQETILEQCEETAMSNDTFRQHLSDNYRLLVTDAYGQFVESFGTQTLLPPLTSAYGISFSGSYPITFPSFLAAGDRQEDPNLVTGYFLSTSFSCPPLKVRSYATCYVTLDEPDPPRVAGSTLQEYLQAATALSSLVVDACKNVPAGQGAEAAVVKELKRLGYPSMYHRFVAQFRLFRVFPWMYQIMRKLKLPTQDPLNVIVLPPRVSPPAQKRRRTGD